MAPLLWSVIINRKETLSQAFWTEWRNTVVSISTGAADAGAIPMLNASGQIDPSMVPFNISAGGAIDGGFPNSNYGGVAPIDAEGI